MDSPTPPPTAKDVEVNCRLRCEQPQRRLTGETVHKRDNGLLHVGEEGVKSVLLLEELGGAGPSGLISELLHKRWKTTATLAQLWCSEGELGTH